MIESHNPVMEMIGKMYAQNIELKKAMGSDYKRRKNESTKQWKERRKKFYYK